MLAIPFVDEVVRTVLRDHVIFQRWHAAAQPVTATSLLQVRTREIADHPSMSYIYSKWVRRSMLMQLDPRQEHLDEMVRDLRKLHQRWFWLSVAPAVVLVAIVVASWA